MTLSQVIAFDTGPGNMVIDALMERLFQKKYDRDGKFAARGQVLDKVVKAILSEKYFEMKPPKSAGREQFGAAFAAEFLDSCEKAGGKPEDAVATATASPWRALRLHTIGL